MVTDPSTADHSVPAGLQGLAELPLNSLIIIVVSLELCKTVLFFVFLQSLTVNSSDWDVNINQIVGA